MQDPRLIRGNIYGKNYSIIDGPWVIGGDFNSIMMDVEEKKGGIPFRLSTCINFINCMNDCGMTDSGFVGNIHTWCNGRGGTNKIHMRLDRFLHNEEWSNKFSNIKVEHLSIQDLIIIYCWLVALMIINRLSNISTSGLIKRTFSSRSKQFGKI